MPGYEVFGDEERQAINEIFDLNGGVLFAHGFDGMRNGVYRVREYERAFADRFGFAYGQAVSSGTAAVKVALESAGVGPGDEVITQAHTYVATVEAIMAVGAMPVIVDVDTTLNLNPQAFELAITDRTRAVVPVHMMGEMADMDPIMSIARAHDLIVVEDCAQALGANYRGSWAGSFGKSAAFSTDAGKTLNTGEGGMVLTQDVDVYELARAVHDHGHAYADVPRGQDLGIAPGFNFRMTEIQGAIGLVQLRKLDFIVQQQRANKAALMNHLIDLPIEFRRSPYPDGDIGDTIVMFLPTRESARAMVTKLTAAGLGTKNLPDAMQWHFSKHWGHLLSRYEMYEGKFDLQWVATAEILERSVALPVSVRLQEPDVDRISQGVSDACLAAL